MDDKQLYARGKRDKDKATRIKKDRPSKGKVTPGDKGYGIPIDDPNHKGGGRTGKVIPGQKGYGIPIDDPNHKGGKGE